MNKILRWYLDGNISRTKTQVGGTHKLDANYEPLRVILTCRIPGRGTIPTEIDILSDGVSIFNTRPSILNYDTEKVWTTIPANSLRKDSVISLNITQVADQDTARDLTVEMELEEV